MEGCIFNVIELVIWCSKTWRGNTKLSPWAYWGFLELSWKIRSQQEEWKGQHSTQSTVWAKARHGRQDGVLEVMHKVGCHQDIKYKTGDGGPCIAGMLFYSQQRATTGFWQKSKVVRFPHWIDYLTKYRGWIAERQKWGWPECLLLKICIRISCRIF